MSVKITYSPGPVLVPQPGCRWADTMVLNPGIIKDPESERVHMLFRATGPWQDAQSPGKRPPYPIFLGYAYSDDLGRSWTADFSQPAMAPALADTVEHMYIHNVDNEMVVNYANGCIEDPRLVALEGRIYLIVACRMFPPGAYWIKDDPMQCAPDWAKSNDHPFGRAAGENVTVSVLFQVDLNRLASRRYQDAFKYVTHLTDPQRGENRDVLMFAEKMAIRGEEQYVCIHRPSEPRHYSGSVKTDLPSIFVSSAGDFADLATDRTVQSVLAEPLFDWEGSRIGGSWPPIRVAADEWLFAYHGKQDDRIGYTQSFMILKRQGDGLPTVAHRCSDRLMYAQQDWEMPGRFGIPCIFATGGIVVDDQLIISYGAADEKVGIAWTNPDRLVSHVRQFDPQGRKTSA